MFIFRPFYTDGDRNNSIRRHVLMSGRRPSLFFSHPKTGHFSGIFSAYSRERVSVFTLKLPLVSV